MTIMSLRTLNDNSRNADGQKEDVLKEDTITEEAIFQVDPIPAPTPISPTRQPKIKTTQTTTGTDSHLTANIIKLVNG